ncbi:phage tail tape measure protein [Halorubrum trueperi]|uniref:Phage tail tape measure protein n=1 Tax=Halorubrum trueperi TaxID=2004704 RepID=A0ABD5UHF0_9EURY
MAFSTLTGAIRVDASGVSEGVDTAEQEIDSLTGRMQSAGKSMKRTGAAMTAGITAPLLAMGGVAARQSANFDQAMQKSIAVMGDVSDSMREDLEETAREVATATTMSHQQAADSYYFLASAGLDAAESMEAMPKVASFAEAGQMDMAEATDVATNVMSAFGYEASQMTEVTDTLTATVTSHNQTMEGMSTAMSRVAPTAAGMGIEIEEAAAAIGLLGDVGIQGERAGTSLNRALTVLSNPTGRAAETIEKLGVSIRDSNGDLRSITEIMGDFEAAGADTADMAAIFGSEAGPAMASLLQQGSGALEESTTRLKEAEGATQDVAQTQRKTLNAELQIMRSNLEDAGVAIGANLLPMLSTLSGYVSQAGSYFAGLSDKQQNVAIATAGVAAAAGPLLLAGGTLLTMLPAMASGFAMVSAASLPVTGPILAIVAAVGLLGAAFATDFMGIRGMTMDAVGVVTDNLDLLKNGLLAAIGPVGWMYKAWEMNFLGIQNRTQQAKDLVLNNLDLVKAAFLALMGPIGWAVLAYQKNIGGFGDAMDEQVDRVVSGVNWIVKRITEIPQELQDLIDRIPGVDGEEVADKLFPPKPAEKRAEETGKSVAEAADDGVSQQTASLSSKEKQLLSGGRDPHSVGEDAGSEIAKGAKSGVEDELSNGPIKGEMTPEIRAALEEGVNGYVSDPDEIEDAPTEINEDLYEAVRDGSGVATAETLGVSEKEFATLLQRFEGGGAAGPAATAATGGSGTSTSSAGGGSGTGTGSTGLSASEFKTALREVLDGFRLETRLETDQRGLEQWIEDIAEAQLTEAASGGRP